MRSNLKSWQRLLTGVAGTVAAMLAATVFADETEISLETLLHEMTDYTAVARWPSPEYTCRQSSSYDRRSKTPRDPAGGFANTDNMDGLGADLRWETIGGRRECVMLDVAGPGCIVRFWSGGNPPKGKIRFYLDGTDQPAIEGPLSELFSGKGFVPRPLAIENAGSALNFYLPVPYAKHCKITYDETNPANPQGPPPGRWYNIEYRTYAPGTNVKSFAMADYRALRPAVERTAHKLLNPPNPGATGDYGGISLEEEIGPGREASIRVASGPGAVRLLEVRLRDLPKSEIDQALRSTVLRADFDGEPTIWCPLGDFFGSGVGLNRLDSWYRTVDKDGMMACRWVMPYEKSGSFTLVNLGRQKVSVRLRAAVSPWKWDDRSMHFHANWRQQNPIPTRPMIDWNYVKIAGKGVYIGDTLAVMNPVANWWGEGDEKIWVDAEKFPSHFGTGSEDYYGYAWGNPTPFQGPFCNQPRAGAANRGHTTNTRTRSLDAIPFQKSLDCNIEVWHWADCKVAYSVATYWFALPGARSNRGPAPAEAAAPIPHPPQPATIRGAIECEAMTVAAKSPGLEWVRQDSYPFAQGNWSNDAQILYYGKKPGDFVELLVAENVSGPRKTVVYGTKSYDYGILRFSVNGRRVEKEFDGYSPKPVLTGPIDLGVFQPKDGRFVLRAEVTGSNPQSKGPRHYFGLDAVVLSAP